MPRRCRTRAGVPGAGGGQGHYEGHEGHSLFKSRGRAFRALGLRGYPTGPPGPLPGPSGRCAMGTWARHGTTGVHTCGQSAPGTRHSRQGVGAVFGQRQWTEGMRATTWYGSFMISPRCSGRTSSRRRRVCGPSGGRGSPGIGPSLTGRTAPGCLVRERGGCLVRACLVRCLVHAQRLSYSPSRWSTAVCLVSRTRHRLPA